MKLVLDAGALIALERNDRAMWGRLAAARLARDAVVTHGGVVGQVWRGRGAREARLATALASISVLPLDDALGRKAGALMARAHVEDVVDAALVLLADDGDQVLTSDPDDIETLVLALAREIEVVPV